MRTDYQKRFGELVEELAAAFDKFPSPALGRVIWKVMQDAKVTEDEFEAAVERAVSEWDKWHPPAVLRSLAYAERTRRAGLLRPSTLDEPAPYDPEQFAKLQAIVADVKDGMEIPPEPSLHEEKAKWRV